jgi:ribosomal protein S18 acetylase RimI-like enzyme
MRHAPSAAPRARGVAAVARREEGIRIGAVPEQQLGHEHRFRRDLGQVEPREAEVEKQGPRLGADARRGERRIGVEHRRKPLALAGDDDGHGSRFAQRRLRGEQGHGLAPGFHVMACAADVMIGAGDGDEPREEFVVGAGRLRRGRTMHGGACSRQENVVAACWHPGAEVSIVPHHSRQDRPMLDWTSDLDRMDWAELSDGGDCSYICDIAVHPDHQGTELGRAFSARPGTAPGTTRRTA